MARIPMTLNGVEQLQNELQQLIKVERPNIVESIAEARAHGDLKENAEYHAARERQSFIEGRIKEINEKLANAQVIDVTRIENEGRVIFGATLKLLDKSKDETTVYQIVGDDEADVKQGKISVNSPIARALITRYKGDTVSIDLPAGSIKYEIIDVDYK